jgi:hypothetical protein
MPGSLTPPGRSRRSRVARPGVWPSAFWTASAPGIAHIVAQWLACTSPCRRFADALADACARLGADAGRCSFIVRDSHPLLLAGLSGRD